MLLKYPLAPPRLHLLSLKVACMCASSKTSELFDYKLIELSGEMQYMFDVVECEL